jgi:inorganic pyrophosphatase
MSFVLDDLVSVVSLVKVPDSVEIMVDASHARLFGNLDELAATSLVVVDRPAGSRHPRVAEAVYPVDYGYLEGTVAADGDGVDVFRGSAVGAGVVGFLVTADPGKRDVEVKVLIDCTAEEIDRVQRLLDDVLGIGGLLVRRNLETATGPDGPAAGERPGAQMWRQRGQ